MATPVILYRWVPNKERRVFGITFLILHSEIKFKFLIKILVLLLLNNNKTKIDY